jgi:Fur family transcriptional regulator, stress-responsive regulator
VVSQKSCSLPPRTGTTGPRDLDSIQNRGYTAAMSGTGPTEFEALLRRNGLQVTAQRVAVLRAVAERPHGTADEVYRAVRAGTGPISRQAVYDALATFTDRGLLRRIQPGGAPARYENRVGDNHHHLICRACGRMVDVDCAVGYAPCLTAGGASGFEIDEAEVVFWGRCPGCAAVVEDDRPRGIPDHGTEQERGRAT